jgi:hypothetical protein
MQRWLVLSGRLLANSLELTGLGCRAFHLDLTLAGTARAFPSKGKVKI